MQGRGWGKTVVGGVKRRESDGVNGGQQVGRAKDSGWGKRRTAGGLSGGWRIAGGERVTFYLRQPVFAEF